MNLMVVLVAIGLMVLLLVLLRLEANLREIRKRRTIAAPALKRRTAHEREPEIEVFFDSSSLKK